MIDFYLVKKSNQPPPPQSRHTFDPTSFYIFFRFDTFLMSLRGRYIVSLKTPSVTKIIVILTY